MKVLIYTHEFPPFQGGLATTSLKIAKGFSQAGIDTTVLAPSYLKDDRSLDRLSDFTVRRMGFLAKNHGIPFPVREIVGLVFLSKYLRRNQPDVILLITREAHLVGAMLLDSSRYRVVVRAAGYEANRFLLGKKWKNRFLGMIMKTLYNGASRIVSPSESTKRLFAKSKIPERKLKVIHNGIPKDLILRKTDPKAVKKLRERYGIVNSEKVILTLSRIVPGKGQDKMIEALSLVRKYREDFRYIIAGEGSYKIALLDLVKSKGISDRVIFTGPVRHEQVWDFYDLCDIFAMVNRTIKEKENIEGLPNVLMEAASRAKPIITGTDGGSEEAVEHGRTGYVVNGTNIEQIAEHITTLLSDEFRRDTFGAMGKKKMLEEFTEEEMIKKYLKVIGYEN